MPATKRSKKNTPTQEQLRLALTQVNDPELGDNIVNLGMVRNITITRRHVNITLALTMLACPLRDYLQEQTKMAASAVPGVKSVTVELTAMSEEESGRLRGAMSDMPANRVGCIVAIMSGKGGVGKSSVTALLAAALRRQDYCVGVLDADITGPCIPRLFGISGPVRGIPMGILPVETPMGIKVMSTNLMLPEEDMAIIWRGPVMSNTIKQFWTNVLWGQLDFLLIDLPPGTSDATLTAMQSLPLDGVVMVTTPQNLASMVVRKTVHMAQELKVPIIGVIENMSYFQCPETGNHHLIFGPSHTDEVAELAQAPIIGRLPIDPGLAQWADNGEIEHVESAIYADLAAAFLKAVMQRVSETVLTGETDKRASEI